MKTLYTYFEHLGEVQLTTEMVDEIAVSGRNDEAVAHWAPRFASMNDSALAPHAVRAALAEYGAWDDEELEDDAANIERILWLAAHDIREREAD